MDRLRIARFRQMARACIRLTLSWREPRGDCVMQSSNLARPVGGAQTAQRAEVAAALAAIRAVNELVELISDSRWVVRGIATIAARANPCDWKHADL